MDVVLPKIVGVGAEEESGERCKKHERAVCPCACACACSPCCSANVAILRFADAAATTAAAVAVAGSTRPNALILFLPFLASAVEGGEHKRHEEVSIVNY